MRPVRQWLARVLPVPASQNLWNFHGCAEDDKHHCKACFCRKNHLNDPIQKHRSRGDGTRQPSVAVPGPLSTCARDPRTARCVIGGRASFLFLGGLHQPRDGQSCLATSGLLHVVSPMLYSRVVFRGVVCIFCRVSGRKQPLSSTRNARPAPTTGSPSCDDPQKLSGGVPAQVSHKCSFVPLRLLQFRFRIAQCSQLRTCLAGVFFFASLHSAGATPNAR